MNYKTFQNLRYVVRPRAQEIAPLTVYPVAGYTWLGRKSTLFWLGNINYEEIVFLSCIPRGRCVLGFDVLFELLTPYRLLIVSC
jgi:hypothetical protein